MTVTLHRCYDNFIYDAYEERWTGLKACSAVRTRDPTVVAMCWPWILLSPDSQTNACIKGEDYKNPPLPELNRSPSPPDSLINLERFSSSINRPPKAISLA